MRQRAEVLKNKQKVIQSFFDWVRKSPGEVEPTDVRAWCERLRDEGKIPATVYAHVSFLSSFYRWAMSHPSVGTSLRPNPALLACLKRTRLYQTEATKAWTDEELRALTDVVRQKAASGNLAAKRDLTLLLLYTSTGLRREVISLRGQDVTVEKDGLILSGGVKGGRYKAREVQDPEVRAALLDYLTASNRLRVLRTDARPRRVVLSALRYLPAIYLDAAQLIHPFDDASGLMVRRPITCRRWGVNIGREILASPQYSSRH